MQNERNIEELKNRLLSLGFPGGLEGGLRAQICLQRPSFSLHYRRHREGDVLNVTLHFQRAEEAPQYHCLYYEACLRKREVPPALLLQGVDTGALVQRMEEVDWRQPLPAHFSEESAGAAFLSSGREERIEAIITDLRTLEETAEGAAIARQLKWTFWADTPLEALVPELSRLKSSREVAQRFYFFEGEDGITLEEAFRYLAHRWREKQWQAQKKEAPPHPLAEENGTGDVGKAAPSKGASKEARRKG